MADRGSVFGRLQVCVQLAASAPGEVASILSPQLRPSPAFRLLRGSTQPSLSLAMQCNVQVSSGVLATLSLSLQLGSYSMGHAAATFQMKHVLVLAHANECSGSYTPEHTKVPISLLHSPAWPFSL